MNELRAHPRYKVVLPVLCSMQGRADFYAVTADISVGGIRMRTSAQLRPDEMMVCRLRHIGALTTRVLRADADEFVVQVLTARPAADRFVRQLMLISRQQTLQEEPTRVHARIVPRVTDVVVTLANGDTAPARILNVSASGIGLALDPAPEAGELILVGSTPARVAPRFEHG